MRRQHKTGVSRLAGFPGVLAAGCVLMMAVQGRAGILVDFEDLQPGAQYGPGESFVTDGVRVTLPLGTGRSAAEVEVENLAGSGNILAIKGLVDFSFSEPIVGLAFYFEDSTQVRFPAGEFGSSFGLRDLAATGKTVTVENLMLSAALDPIGPFYGIATVSAVNGSFDHIDIGEPGPRARSRIDTLTYFVPEPGSIWIFGAIGVMLIVRRVG